MIPSTGLIGYTHAIAYCTLDTCSDWHGYSGPEARAVSYRTIPGYLLGKLRLSNSLPTLYLDCAAAKARSRYKYVRSTEDGALRKDDRARIVARCRSCGILASTMFRPTQSQFLCLPTYNVHR